MLNQFPNTYWFEPTPETRLYKTTGTFSFVIPEGVKKIFISCAPAAGGGGGGGAGETHIEGSWPNDHRVYNNGTSGGGGGTKAIVYRQEIDITQEASVCTLIIGKGGAGGARGLGNAASGANGLSGEPSVVKINNQTTMTFNGGGGGSGGPGYPNRSAPGGSDGGGTGTEPIGKGSFINKVMYGGDGGYRGYGYRNPGSYAATSGQDGTNARILVEWFDDDLPTGSPFQLLFPEIPAIYLDPILISK